MTSDILQGWKSIAAFLERDERTVRRWEKLHGLPVRRLTSERRSSVYAIPIELEEWLLQPRSLESQIDIPSDLESAGEDVFEAPINDGNSSKAVLLPASRGGWAAATRIALVGAVLVMVAGLVFYSARNLKSQRKLASELQEKAAEVDEETLEGEFLLERRTPESLQRALERFTARTQKPPSSAAAYAGLAKTYCLLREYSAMPSSEAFPLSERAAQAALQLDKDNADAHAVLGFADFFWRWNADGAEQHFLTAIKLAPSSSLARQWYGSMMMHQGRSNEALRQLNLAQKLSPWSSSILSLKAMALATAGNRTSAVEILSKLEAAAPDAPSPHRALAYVSLYPPANIPLFLTESGRFAAARGDTSAVGEMTRAEKIYQHAGETSMWRFLLQEEKRHLAQSDKPSLRMAQMEAMLGDDDEAIADVAALVKRHEESATGISIDPAFSRLQQSGRLAPVLETLATLNPHPLFR